MNKNSSSFVTASVRVSVSLLMTGSVLLFASCSGSRSVGADLELPGGRSVIKTVKGSDVFIASGSELDVAYSDRNRFFVASGGALVGFQKGVQNTKIYAEKGAVIPDARRLRGFSVITVKDASIAYRDRYKELPPADMKPGSGNQGGVVPIVGVGVGAGFWGGGWGGWGGRGFRSARGSSRPSSVRTSSYKRKD